MTTHSRRLPARKPQPRSTPTTRDRILSAAIERFSRRSYEQTVLRDIAADVGVDVAYVHRCFGSKERLFGEALKASVNFAERLSGPADFIACSLTNHALSERARNGRAVDIVVRSFASPEAVPIIREFVLKGVVRPLSEKLDQPNTTRIALTFAILTGVAIFRNVLRVGPMLEPQGGALEGLVAGAIQGVIRGTEYEKPTEEPERIS